MPGIQMIARRKSSREIVYSHIFSMYSGSKYMIQNLKREVLVSGMMIADVEYKIGRGGWTSHGLIGGS